MSASALTLWARLLLGTLARSGIRDVVISPGSRSTPFTHAALTTDGLKTHALWDERVAGFFALGQVRVTGRPTLLLCTSGSAATHYFPALVEASASYVPLLVLTADRPFELSACGAPQTMDQLKLFGDFARGYFELGHPDSSAGALDGLERMAAQAVALARGPVPGPVHLNARARKPLEPVLPSGEDEQRAWDSVTERLSRPAPRIFSSVPAPSREAIEALATACRDASRGLIVCGPMPAVSSADAAAIFELSAVSGFPIFTEATSQLRFSDAGRGAPRIGALDTLLRSRRASEFAPDLVLQFGAPPTSSALARWLGQTSVPRAVVMPYGHLDPQSRARWIVQHDVFATARAVSRELGERSATHTHDGARRSFRERLERADALYFELVEAAGLAADAPLSEAVAVRRSVAALPAGAWLGLGNSLPVRDVDAFVAPSTSGLRIWSQRGLNGIDGLISGAIGAANAARAPSLLLVGDVSFLHDVAGLAAASSVETPLAIVVIDNAGGRIFSELPVARLFEAQPELSKYWLTPPAVELAHAASLYKVAYDRVETGRDLDRALQGALARPSVSLIHAVVAPDSARRDNAVLLEHFDAALSAALAD